LRPSKKRDRQQKEYTILLPLKHNDGSPVSPDLILQTRDELVRRFGGATFDPGTLEGHWIHATAMYADE
jgi:hypothetical protein